MILLLREALGGKNLVIKEAVVSVLTQSPRISILSISILFIAGGILLYYVDEDKAKKMLAEYNE